MARLKETSAILLDSKLPLAVTEGWTLSRLAAECHCGRDAARTAIGRYRDAIQRQSQVELKKQCLTLVEEARKARDSALALLERHAVLVERAIAQLEDSDDFDIGDLGKLTKLNLDHHRLVEQLTGLDVAKKVLLKQRDTKDGIPVSWDGVEALDAMPFLELLEGDDD